MREFDPDRPARLHEVLNDKVITWRTGWSREWRRNAVTNGVDGSVSWYGLIFDGWEPIGHESRDAQ
jgi:hypothetical protein